MISATLMVAITALRMMIAVTTTLITFEVSCFTNNNGGDDGNFDDYKSINDNDVIV